MPVSLWKKKSERLAYQGWRSMLVKTFELPDGKQQEYDIIRNSPYVVVAAFTTKKEAIFIRQFRPGPEKILSSFCEGYIDENETPETAARRELLEETGYRAGSIRYVRTLHTAYSTEERICFIALDCEYERPPAGDDDEYISVQTMPCAVFLPWACTEASNFASLDALLLAINTAPELRD